MHMHMHMHMHMCSGIDHAQSHELEHGHAALEPTPTKQHKVHGESLRVAEIVSNSMSKLSIASQAAYRLSHSLRQS